MPIPYIAHLFREGLSAAPWLWPVVRITPWLVVLAVLKLYFSGARNQSERNMHSKVVMITGGTSGIGAVVARRLASRGAQVILLTQQPPSDPFVVEYVEDLRASTSNSLIYAEQVDLASLHSIRLFATKWVDNAPPRRLDMVVLCAATINPARSARRPTRDGLEACWGVNFLANFHLLSILSPAIRAQPADRDVRVVVAACAGYVAGDLKGMRDDKSPLPPGREYPTSKLALMVFASAFQKHLDAYPRPDKSPCNARVVLVDPGLSRTPGTRRWLSMGSLLGLLAYAALWPAWWLLLKSADAGAQGFLKAAMEADLGRGPGGKLLRECRETKPARPEIGDETVEKELWTFAERQIVALEKEGAVRRAVAKKKKEDETEGSAGSNKAKAVNDRPLATTSGKENGPTAAKRIKN